MVKLNKIGFFQALGVTAYCSLAAFVIWNGEKIFGQMKSYFGPVTFLLFFSTSALTCALIVFYKPYKLFFEGKKKEAIDTVFSTAAYLFMILVIFLTGLYLNK